MIIFSAATNMDDVIYIDVSPEKSPKLSGENFDDSGVDILDVSDDDDVLDVSRQKKTEEETEIENAVGNQDCFVIHDCFVKIKNHHVDSDKDEEEESESESEEDDAKDVDYDEGYVSPSPVTSKKTDNNRKRDSTDLSEYEKIREENIRQRKLMLETLGIQSGFQELLNDSITSRKNQKRKPSSELDPSQRRKSARLAAKERDEDEDYVPNYREDSSDDKYALDDPADHSHDGIRRNPCKECSNCLKPDCRRCVFCRDKPKYGGKNIKKQKCMYKDKCSNPIVVCNICNGSRSFSCNICGEKFSESYLVDQHKERRHNVEQVRRRSSRISQQSLWRR